MKGIVSLLQDWIIVNTNNQISISAITIEHSIQLDDSRKILGGIKWHSLNRKQASVRNTIAISVLNIQTQMLVIAILAIFVIFILHLSIHHRCL